MRRFFKRLLLGRLAALAPAGALHATENLSLLGQYSHWLRQHDPPLFPDRAALWEQTLRDERLDRQIDYLEFGVARGASLRWWLEHNSDPASRFVGFDTFEGLPEAWIDAPAGTFSTGGRPPEIDDSRCRFEVGLFQETLPPFLPRLDERTRRVVHLDADLFSSTLFVLTTLAPRLRRGDVLLFDELGAPRSMTGEFKALRAFADAYRARYRVLGAARDYTKAALAIESIGIAA